MQASRSPSFALATNPSRYTSSGLQMAALLQEEGRVRRLRRDKIDLNTTGGAAIWALPNSLSAEYRFPSLFSLSMKMTIAPHKTVAVAFLMVTAAFMAGCASEQNSGNRESPTGFKINAVYRTNVPVVACIYHNPPANPVSGIRLLGPSDSSPLPESQKVSNVWTYTTYEVFPAGTEVRVLAIRRIFADLDAGTVTEIGAQMVSGPYKGKAVDIVPICKKSSSKTSDGGLLVRDSAILEERSE